MKYNLLILGLIMHLSSSGQKLELFNNIDFDSSYIILGISQGFDGKNQDSLTEFWFLLDNPNDMELLKKEWAFKSMVPRINIESPEIDIYIIQNKRTIHPFGLIYPKQGIITSGNGWYRFDTARLSVLHRTHPFKYHTEKKEFETYNKYAAYGNSIINDTSLLFFNEPSLKYEGRFTVISHRNADPSSPVFKLRDLNNELQDFAPAYSFKAEEVMNDSFNIKNITEVRFRVSCAKSLYEKFKSKVFVKGDWEPPVIEMKLFWKD